MSDDAAASLAAYASLKRERPELFDSRDDGGPGGIRLVTRPEDFASVRAAVESSRDRSRTDGRDTRIGVLAHDPHMLLLRDPVILPDGSPGLYNRVVEGRCVAALPIVRDRIVLIRIFRHGLRRWCWEFPRGGADEGEPLELAVRRELAEEIGARTRSLTDLGDFSPGGSTLAIVGRLFAAYLDDVGEPNRKEGISDIMLASTSEVERMITSAEIIDGFTLAVFLRARLAGLV